jgi:hypothetical protein
MRHLLLLVTVFILFTALKLQGQGKTSIASGNWTNAAIWTPTGVPSSTNNVTIANGHTVVIDANINCNDLTIGTGGTAAELRFSGNTARTVNVFNNLTVNSSATFSILTTSNATHILNIGGNLTNSGIFTMFADNNSLCNVTFNKNGNQTISGTGTLTRFNRITVNMGTSSNNILDISSSSFTVINNFLTLTNGTFKLSTPNAGTFVPFTALTTLAASNGIWLNSATAIMNFSAGINLSGLLRVSSGTMTIGNANNENLTPTAGTLLIQGGVLNIAGRYIASTTATSFSMTGGTMNMPNNGSTSTTQAPFQISIASSTFNMSGGSIVILREGGNGAQDLGFVNTGSGSGSVTGGTLQLGGTGTPASQTLNINSTFTIPNLSINSASVTGKLLTSSLTVLNNISISSGSLVANNLGIALGGNWTNAGLFTPGTGTVTFNGSSAQSILKTGGETFNHLTFSGSSTKTFASAITASGNISIASGSTLDVSASNFSLTLRGNFVNNGSFNARSGLVTLNGAASQSIIGTSATTFNNLTINNTSGVVLGSTANLLGTLSLNNGTFNTNSQVFTLVSDASGTAIIGQLTGTGDIAGNVIVQRFVPGGSTGWAYLGAPISSALTLNDWDDDIFISCATCPDGSAAGFLSVYSYDETQTGVYDATNSYVGLNTINDVIQPNKGYWVYLGTGSVTTANITLDVTGTVRKNNQTINLNFTNTGSTTDDGWNLIQNPYPSAISWTALKGATSNIDNAIYVYNADLNSGTGGTATFINGVSSPAVASGGIGDNIPMCQGFYVHSTGATALNAVESNKVSANPTFLKAAANTNPLMRLKLSNQNPNVDETVLYFEQGASKNFEANFDAYKIRPNDPLAPVLAINYNQIDYQVNGVAILSGTFSIPVKATTGTSGNFTITAHELNSLPNNACVVLYDKFTQTTTDLKTSNYSFYLSDTTSVARFELQITANTLNINTQVNQPSCALPQNGFVAAKGLNQGPWNYVWKVNNTIVKTSLNTAAADTLKNISGGVVDLQINTLGLCDNNESQFNIAPQTPVTAGFTSIDTLFLGQSNNVQVNNTSINSANYLWYSGYNNSTYNGASPTLFYNQPGDYQIKLICTSTSGCVDSLQKKIVVLDGLVSINNLKDTRSFVIKTLANSHFLIEAEFNSDVNVELNVIDIEGKLISHMNKGTTKTLSENIDLSSYPKGVYMLNLTIGANYRSVKIIAD